MSIDLANAIRCPREVGTGLRGNPHGLSRHLADAHEQQVKDVPTAVSSRQCDQVQANRTLFADSILSLPARCSRDCVVSDPAILRGTSTSVEGARYCFKVKSGGQSRQCRWRNKIRLDQCRAVCTKFGSPSASWLDQDGNGANRTADTVLTDLLSAEKVVVRLSTLLKM